MAVRAAGQGKREVVVGMHVFHDSRVVSSGPKRRWRETGKRSRSILRRTRTINLDDAQALWLAHNNVENLARNVDDLFNAAGADVFGDGGLLEGLLECCVLGEVFVNLDFPSNFAIDLDGNDCSSIDA